MYKTALAVSAALVLTPIAAAAQDAPLAVQRADVAPAGNAVLPANTEVLLKMTQEVTTKGRTWKEGDTFKLSVEKDVMLGDYVVIPEGSPAYGRITWLTSKGAFGKSGKMDVELEYVEVGGQKIRLDGTYRQEGEGNTMATVGGVILAGVFAGFITGKSGRIPQGRELMATTEEPIELAVAASEVHRNVKQAALAPTGGEQAVIATPAPVQAAAAE
jgi:hypothetical protein